MTNDTPHRACLADFGFTTFVPDPQNNLLQSPVLEGGTPMFMAPELLSPSKFGLDSSIPTQEGDVYAFGLVILQVIVFDCLPLIFLTIRQVLTGELPFRTIKPQEHAYCVLRGARPDKPADAENIGISNCLWELMQKCWECDRGRRPRIQEVVEGIGNTAANWHVDMPPNGRGKQESYVIEEETDELEGSEFRLIADAIPLYSDPLHSWNIPARCGRGRDNCWLEHRQLAS